MRPFFPNCRIELYEYTEDEEYDIYGEPTISWVFTGDYICDFQVQSSRDSQMMFGKILNDTFKLYLDYDVPIHDKMMIKKQGENDTYIILGSPQKYDHFLKHQEVTVQKTRKPWQTSTSP